MSAYKAHQGPGFDVRQANTANVLLGLEPIENRFLRQKPRIFLL